MVGAPAFMRGSSAFKPGGSRRTILLRLHPRVFGIFRTGQGTPTPGLKPDERDCDSFRDAGASLPPAEAGGSHQASMGESCADTKREFFRDAEASLPAAEAGGSHQASMGESGADTKHEFSATLKRRSALLKQRAPTRLPWESRALIQNMSCSASCKASNR